MTGSFTPDELRLLAISDKAQGGGGRKPVRRFAPQVVSGIGRPPSGMLGKLTDAEAAAMHHSGATRAQIALAADVGCEQVSRWRSAQGLARVYVRKDDA
jgi:hypothetical protein